jgi:mannosyl-oligosaccharide glucosidase
MAKYGWTAHDGRNFGIHDLYENQENRFTIRNSWVKRQGGEYGGDWAVKTEVNPFDASEPPKFVSIFFYFAKSNTGWIRKINKNKQTLDGETDDVGSFKVRIDLHGNQNVFLNVASLNTPVAVLHDTLASQSYFSRIKTKLPNLKEYVGLRGIGDEIESANTIVYQVSGFVPFEFQLIFESESLLKESKEKYGKEPKELNGPEFDAALARAYGNFQKKFDTVFGLRDRKASGPEVMMAQAALSNLIGGIGFFTGQSIVQSMFAKEPVLYWKSNLYTAVPSRSFFPRGFLWDEGFHNILISQWDSEITKDIIAHWLDLMNVEGWLPR